MTKALIIGGGIAGPVTAMALQRAGIDSTIYEARAPEESAGGAFLTVAVNGLDALRAIDAHAGVLAAGFPSRRIELQSGTGKRLGEVPIGGELPDGTTTLTLRRADLYRALLGEAWDRGIPIEHGKRLRDVSLTPGGGVLARFEDGTEAAADLLIGADGIFSRTRRIIDPGAPAPRYTGLGNIGGFCRQPSVTEEPGKYVMIFGRRAFFGYLLSPSGEVWWFANPPRRAELTRAELASLDQEQWKERLVALFADDAGPAVEIIRATVDLSLGANQYDMPRVPRWWRGPMIVIGDAAHAASPTSGQGASLAIEDAVTLAQCLRDLPDTWSAFVAYEQMRRPRVERIVAWAARMNSNKIPGPMLRAVRDLVLPLILKRQGSADSQRWIFDHHIEWDARVTLGQAA
jgi:2-polyprenyl-6-methoxyphenol hydroxylase-like FAD-dependent oxidoreductase